MAARPRATPRRVVNVRSTLAVAPSTLAVLALGLVVLAAGLLVRGAPQLGPPTLAGLAVGAREATPAELTAAGADALETALTSGSGITFEIVQTAMIVARDGGPLVEVPDPHDPAKSLGEAERYALGTLIERGSHHPMASGPSSSTARHRATRRRSTWPPPRSAARPSSSMAGSTATTARAGTRPTSCRASGSIRRPWPSCPNC